MKKMAPQIEKLQYFGLSYLTPARFASYGYQLSEIIALEPENVLEIGIGNGLIGFLLRKGGWELTTLDSDESLSPDIAASVTNIPLKDDSFDIIACFEVLEHLPFAYFRIALKEIKRVSRRYAIISLPDCKHCIRLRLPKIGRRRFLLEWPLFRSPKHIFNGEHYWEINKQGYPLRAIISEFEKAGFFVEETYRVWEKPEHRFFRVRKK